MNAGEGNACPTCGKPVGGDLPCSRCTTKATQVLPADTGFDSVDDLTQPGEEPAPTPRSAAIGSVIAGRYQLQAKLGQGGMGRVFRALDLKLDQPIALKFLHTGRHGPKPAISPLLDEVRLARQITHPNVCRIYDIGEVGGHHFLTMELIEGPTLHKVLRDQRPELSLALELGCQLCAGLGAAHELGILHCDLKPSNVMLDHRGQIRLTDFGLAMWRDDSQDSAPAAGTPAYMAPELLTAGLGHSTSTAPPATPSALSDLYSLGLVLHELLTGRHPERRPDGETPSLQVQGLDPSIDRVIRRCLHREPERRPSSVADVAEALRGPGPLGSAPYLGVILALAPGTEAPPCEPEAAATSSARSPRSESSLATAPRQLNDPDLLGLIARHGGQVTDSPENAGSESPLAVFRRPGTAVQCALELSSRLREARCQTDSPGSKPARRVPGIGIHLAELRWPTMPTATEAAGLSAAAQRRITGERVRVENNASLEASALARLGRGGHVLISAAPFDIARKGLQVGMEGSQWLAHGSFEMHGLQNPLEVCEVVAAEASPAELLDSAFARRQVAQLNIPGWRPAPGHSVPGKPGWTLQQRLGEGGFGEVWLAARPMAEGGEAEQRVFKFCLQRERLRALQREITVFRLLRDTLGERPDINRILDWSFAEAPFYIELEHTAGGSLLDLADELGGIAALDLNQRLELVAQIANALAAAHSVGVLHKDVKPANVLIERTDHGLQAKLSDFGLGHVLEKDQLAQVGITALGWSESLPSEALVSPLAGTRLYLAPELLEGRAATVKADVYALGVLLYQMVVGDLGRALAPGWERDIEEDLLREDIARAVDGNPARRHASAQLLADSLRDLEPRRTKRQQAIDQAQAEHRAQEAMRRLRQRFRWVAAIALLLAATSAAVLFHNRRVSAEAAAVQKAQDFLVDLFALPEAHQQIAESIPARRVLDRGVEKIDRDLAQDPELRARLLHTLGEAYFNLGLRGEPEELLRRSVVERKRLFGEQSQATADSLKALAAVLNARGEWQQARPFIDQAIAIERELWGDHGEQLLESHNILAGVVFYSGDLQRAQALYQEVLEQTRALRGEQHMDSAEARRSLGMVLSRAGELEAAEAHLLAAVEQLSQSLGIRHVRVALTQRLLALLWQRQGKAEAAVELYRESLQTYRELLGTAHPSFRSGTSFLASALIDAGGLDEARELYLESLASYRNSSPLDHGSISFILDSLAQIAVDQERYAAAETHYREALQSYSKSSSFDPAAAASLSVDLATTLVYRDKLEEALITTESAIRTLQRELQDEDHRWLRQARDLEQRIRQLLGTSVPEPS